jgi:hypothetical protein
MRRRSETPAPTGPQGWEGTRLLAQGLFFLALAVAFVLGMVSYPGSTRDRMPVGPEGISSRASVQAQEGAPTPSTSVRSGATVRGVLKELPVQ